MTGLAWSGQRHHHARGCFLDGGKNWQQARIDGPSLDKALHRFYLDFDWDGSSCCCSRARWTRPAMSSRPRTSSRRARGENSIYHNNGIQTWHVKADGEVENVEVGEAPVETAAAAAAPEQAPAADMVVEKSQGAFGLGRKALPEEIAAWDIDIRPDGTGLPEGSGTVAQGEPIYTDNCAVCHGDFGEGAGRWPVLAGGQDTLRNDRPEKTIGSYWPYLSTVFDYVRRAMPFGNARSLSDDDVYALTAYLLYLNDVVDDEEFELSKENFASVRLPNEANFIPDDRASEPHYAESVEPCMTECKPGPVEITARARVIDVTPEGEGDENSGGSID
jgi:mono/diheme cytochrome c family protein